MMARIVTNHFLRLALVALLLSSELLVTAHAFGDFGHAVQDNCEICHQFDRQGDAPLTAHIPLDPVRIHSCPQAAFVPQPVCSAPRAFDARGSPLA